MKCMTPGGGDGDVGKVAQGACHAFQWPDACDIGNGCGQRVVAFQDAQRGHQFWRFQTCRIEGGGILQQAGLCEIRAVFEQGDGESDIPDHQLGQIGTVCKESLQQKSAVPMFGYGCCPVGKGLIGKQARLFLPTFKSDAGRFAIRNFRKVLYLVQKHRNPQAG